MTMRTNPAYLELAYKKAVVVELMNVLREKYTPAFGDTPDKTIICEDVFRDDSEVPQDAIEEFIKELAVQESKIDLELNRFEFVKRGEDGNVSGQKAAKGNGRSGKAGGKAKAQRRAGNKARARQSRQEGQRGPQASE